MEPKRAALAEGEETAKPAIRTTEVRLDICLGPSPIAAFKAAIFADREYHLGWHSNLACAAMDAFAGAGLPFEIRWQRSQEAARRFIDVLFAGDEVKPEPITNAEVRSGPDPQSDPEESNVWLAKVIASIVEAGKHEGPLDGRKLLGDLEKAVTLVMLGKMLHGAETKDRALLEAALKRTHVEIGCMANKLLASGSTNVELRAEAENLRTGAENLRAELIVEQNRGALARSKLTLQNKYEVEEKETKLEYYVLINASGAYYYGARIWGSELRHARSYTEPRADQHAAEKDCRIISKSDAVKRDRDDRWLIYSASTGLYYRAAGDGLAEDVTDAHRYTWIEAMNTFHNSRDRVRHIADTEAHEA